MAMAALRAYMTMAARPPLCSVFTPVTRQECAHRERRRGDTYGGGGVLRHRDIRQVGMGLDVASQGMIACVLCCCGKRRGADALNRELVHLAVEDLPDPQVLFCLPKWQGRQTY
jgi:hypothetical protein